MLAANHRKLVDQLFDASDASIRSQAEHWKPSMTKVFRTGRRLGILQQMQNRLPVVWAEFETAISLDPNNMRTYLHLDETYRV